MNKLILKGLTAVSVLTSLALTSACNSENDITLKDVDQDVHEDSWRQQFGEIDPNQDWSLAGSAKANISIFGLEAGKEYQLHLYANDPLSHEDAMLIASKSVITDAAGDASADFQVDLVKGDSVFYACYIDSEYRRNVKSVHLSDGKIEASFGQSFTRASANADNIDIPEVQNVESEAMGEYSQAKDIISYEQEWMIQNDNIYIIPKDATYSKTISQMGWGTRTLYVDGTWEINGKQDIAGTCLIVVNKGGVIKLNGQLASNNGGRIIVLAGGKIEGSNGSIEFSNGSGNTFDYNGGTIEVKSMNNNGGTFQNYGVARIDELKGNSMNSKYINHNQMYITDCSEYNLLLLNACRIEVEKNFNSNQVIMGEGAYLKIKGNLTMAWATEILLAANAYLQVNGETNLNNSYIVGPTQGWAICEFNNITNVNRWVYGGNAINNLYLSFDNTSGSYEDFIGYKLNGNNEGNGNARIVQKGQANVSIDAQESCTQIGYTPQAGPANVASSAQGQSFILACEDLGDTGDRDFNDIIFSVSHVAGSKEMFVTALAAGGTLPAEIYYEDQLVGEVHNLLGSPNTGQILNTSLTSDPMISHKATPVSIGVDENWTFEANKQKFSVKITQKSRTKTISLPNKGDAPFMIAVPGTWQWPGEKVNIDIAYPEFEKWSKNAEVNSTWMTHSIESAVIKR